MMTSSLQNGDIALTKLLASLEEARPCLSSSDEDFGFLSTLLKSKELKALVSVHERVAGSTNDESLQPLMCNGGDFVDDLLLELHPLIPHFAEAGELVDILTTSHFQGLIRAHDSVASKDYFPRLSDIPLEVDEDEETVKIVQLVKSNEPLGATIKAEDKTGRILIARIMHGGAADRSGLIHVGDEVHEVNGISVQGKTPADVLSILQSSESTITFKLIPAESKWSVRESKIRVRAHFDYVAAEDRFIPCKEAGLDFKKGDILHIVNNQEDPYWWQARKEMDRNMRAGLIPSRALQERKILAERNSNDRLGDESDDWDREEVATYEEVAKLWPRAGLPRPIVLIGPPGVGRNELKRRLLASDPKYKTTVPYTSRARKSGEADGVEYHFLTREDMEEDIIAGKFVEHGEYKGHLYGTSAEDIRSLINAGYVPIINPHYQALKHLRTPEFRPYVIFIKPPPFERLKETRHCSYARSTFDATNSREFTDEEFQEICHSAARIEFLYSHWFDEVILNDDLCVAFEQLLEAARRVETEPLWVPSSWVQ